MRALKEQELTEYLKTRENIRRFSMEEDFEKLKSLLHTQWNLGRRYSGVSAEYAGKVYANLILSCSQYLFTLVNEDNRPVGFVGLENRDLKGMEPFKSLSEEYLAKFNKLISFEYVGNSGLLSYYNSDSTIEEVQRKLFKNLLSILIVDKDYRNRGMGNELIEVILDVMAMGGCKEDEPLSIYITNKCNLEFYKRLGAEEVDKRVNGLENETQYLYIIKR